MARRPRRNYTTAFKTKMALAAIRGENTVGTLMKGGSFCFRKLKLERIPEKCVAVFG